MNEVNRQILSGLTAAITLAGLAMTTQYVFWFIVCISAGIGLGTYFSIPAAKAPEEIDWAPGVTQADLVAATQVMDTYIQQFGILRKKATDPGLKQSIREMEKLLARIRQNFLDDPRDLALSGAANFLKLYLVRSHDIVTQYVRLSSKSLEGRASDRLADSGEIIGRIQTGFEKFYQECLQNDFLDLEVDGETLKAIVEMEEDPH